MRSLTPPKGGFHEQMDNSGSARGNRRGRGDKPARYIEMRIFDKGKQPTEVMKD
jgi:hypothetical protein